MRRVQAGIVESRGPVPRFPRGAMRHTKISGAFGCAAMQVDRHGTKTVRRGERKGRVVGPHCFQTANKIRDLPRLIVDGLKIRSSAQALE